MNVCWDSVATEATEVNKNDITLKNSQVLFLSKLWISNNSGKNNGSQHNWIINHTAIHVTNVTFLSDNDFQWDGITILYALYTLK